MLISWSCSRFLLEGGPRRWYDISSATSINLPRSNRIIVESLKASIRRGHRILDKVCDYLKYGDSSSTRDFFYKLNTLWKLCVVVGAGICEPHNFASEEVTATSLEEVEDLHKLFLDIERRVNSHIAEDSRPSRTQFVGLMDQLVGTYGKDMDISIYIMTYWNFELNAKPLSGEDGLKI